MARRRAPALAGLLLVALAGLGPAEAQPEVPVPRLEARVTDLTGTLAPGAVAQLEQKLAAFEARKGSQIAVLLVPTTGPEAIEQYAIRVAERWKLGRKGVDDGVILVVARDDRRLRIEVGYGLEGVLTDAVAKRIIDDIVVPRFRAGDLPGGIDAGVEAIVKAIDGEPLPAPARRAPAGSGSGWSGDPGSVVFPVLILLFVGGILRAILGRLGAAGVVGVLAGAVAWFIVGSVAIALIAAAVTFVLVLVGAVGPAGGGRASAGSWGGSRSAGGGGFRSGGGSFGGGGASGRW
jgi:uncharacterized protein